MKNEINSIIQEDCINILNRINLESLKNSQVLIAGSNGLLGKYLVHTIYLANKLRDLNCKIYCVSLHKPNKEIERLLPDKNIVPIQADLSRQFHFENKIDYIFHAASYGQTKLWLQDKWKTITLHVDTVKSLLDLAQTNKAKFMFLSSCYIYGYIPKDMRPAAETYNGSCSTTALLAGYSESKRMGETICSIYKNEYNVNTYVVRISHAYGPGISIYDERPLGNFIKQALFDKEINMLDEGKSVKTSAYVADVIYMILKVMLEGKELVYNIGGTELVSIRNIAEEVSKHCGNVPVIIPSKKAELEHIGIDPGYAGLDISKFIKEFGKVNFMNLSEGIQRTVDWNREEFNIGK